MDRSWIDPIDHGSTMDRSWSSGIDPIDPCIGRGSIRTVHGSIRIDPIDPIDHGSTMDRSWSSGIDPCTVRIGRGSIRTVHGSIRIDRGRPTTDRLQLHRSILVRLTPFFFLNFVCDK
jgi:hypothetical protein